MSESKEHKDLVKIIYDNVSKSLPMNMGLFINIDSPENPANLPPILLSKHRPDIFFKHLQDIYIGEAKTSNDIFTEHSIEQYSCYMEYLNLFDGDRELIICVPFIDFIKTKNYFKKLKTLNSIKYRIRILNDKGDNCLI